MNAKYIAPILVILLCGVAITGAGYAYNSQLDNAKISGTDATFFQIALADGENAVYEEKVTGATVKFNQVYDAKAKESTFKTAGNVIGTFGTQIDDSKSNHASGYKLVDVKVTCVEDANLHFTAKISEDGKAFTISVAEGQVPASNPGQNTTYTLEVSISAVAVEEKN